MLEQVLLLRLPGFPDAYLHRVLRLNNACRLLARFAQDRTQNFTDFVEPSCFFFMEHDPLLALVKEVCKAQQGALPLSAVPAHRMQGGSVVDTMPPSAVHLLRQAFSCPAALPPSSNTNSRDRGCAGEQRLPRAYRQRRPRT